MKISRETKALILGLKPSLEPSIKRNRRSMLHDISAFEFINNIDDTYPTTQPDDTPNENNNTLLENATSLHYTKISLTDICNVLSTTNSNNPTNQKGKPISNNCVTVTIDGINYR